MDPYFGTQMIAMDDKRLLNVSEFEKQQDSDIHYQNMELYWAGQPRSLRGVLEKNEDVNDDDLK